MMSILFFIIWIFSYLLIIATSFHFSLNIINKFRTPTPHVSDDSDTFMEYFTDIDRAIREENTMNISPKIEFKELNDITANKIIEELDNRGVSRINNVLKPKQTQDLLQLVNDQWITSKQKVTELNEKNNYFANSKAQDNRWDLKLPFSVIVNDTLRYVLRPGSLLGDTLHQAVGDEGVIMELAAFITTEGAGRQIIHSDTFWSKAPSLFTCTIALQDVDEAMGPTVFIPCTHTEEAFITRANEFMEDNIDIKDSELLSLPHTLSLLLEGQAALYDSRLLHCGGANRSLKNRVLFYFTISNPSDDDNNNISNNNNNDLSDPEGIIHDFDDINIFASIKSENIGYKLKDFRQ